MLEVHIGDVSKDESQCDTGNELWRREDVGDCAGHKINLDNNEYTRPPQDDEDANCSISR